MQTHLNDSSTQSIPFWWSSAFVAHLIVKSFGGKIFYWWASFHTTPQINKSTDITETLAPPNESIIPGRPFSRDTNELITSVGCCIIPSEADRRPSHQLFICCGLGKRQVKTLASQISFHSFTHPTVAFFLFILYILKYLLCKWITPSNFAKEFR